MNEIDVNYPKVSIVIVTYNGKELLEKFLPLVASLRYPNYEVIIVDNASKDGTGIFLKVYYPNFRLVEACKNYGTAEGSNIGARTAKGDYLFFISNDMELDKEILKYMIERMLDDKRIGVCTCKMRRITEKGEKLSIIDSIGADLDIFGFPASRGINQPDNGQLDYFSEVFFSFGGAMLIQKKIFMKAEGYDSEFFTLADDIDLCWRVRLLGYKVVAEPKALLYHRVSATLGSFSRSQKRFMSERNTLRTLLKNYSKGYLTFIIPCYLAILLLEMCFFILICKPLIAQASIKALFWNIKYLKDTFKNRKIAQSSRQIKDSDVWKVMLKKPEKIRLFFDYLQNKKAERWRGYFG